MWRKPSALSRVMSALTLCVTVIIGTTASHGEPVSTSGNQSEPQSKNEETAPMTRSEHIRRIYNAVNKESMNVLPEFYAANVTFEDPLGTIQGLPALTAYYEQMYKNVEEIHFDITDEVEQGDKHMVMWTLRMRVKGLNKGEEVSCKGNSFLRFDQDGLVVYHRDYFDMGEFIYQHVPVLRFFVRQVNKRLEHKSE